VAGAQSPFQDARGESSLLFSRGGYAQIAFDKTSARIGYLHDQGGPYFYGFDLTGKLNGDSASLFSDNRLVNDARLRLSYGMRVRSPLDVRIKALQVDQTSLGSDWEHRERIRLLDLDDAAFVAAEATMQQELNEADDQTREDLKWKVRVYEEVKKQRADPAVRSAKRRESENELRKVSAHAASVRQRIHAAGDAQLLGVLRSQIRGLEDEKATTGVSPYETLALQLTGRAASYRRFDGTQPFGSQFSDERFDGYGVSAVFNGLLPGFRYGLSVGYERDNNIDDLALREFTDRQTWVEGGVVRTSDRKVNAYVGDYQVVNRTPVRADLLWWPGGLDRRIGINLYARYDLQDAGSFRPGLGIFVSKPNAPTAVVGGLTILFDHGKPQAAIVAGYSF
jgi:hypothetical protein